MSFIISSWPGHFAICFCCIPVNKKYKYFSRNTVWRNSSPNVGSYIVYNRSHLKRKINHKYNSSNLPGEDMSSQDRYQRSREVIEILKQSWNKEEINFKGQFYNLKLPTNPLSLIKMVGPMLYFGGLFSKCFRFVCRTLWMCI